MSRCSSRPRERLGVCRKTGRANVGVRRVSDEHCGHVERDDGVVQQPTAQVRLVLTQSGSDVSGSSDRRPWAGGQISGAVSGFSFRGQFKFSGTASDDPLYRIGGRGRAGRRLDDGVDESERGRRRLMPGAAADWSQDRRSASMNRPARDARAGVRDLSVSCPGGHDVLPAENASFDRLRMSAHGELVKPCALGGPRG